MKLPSLRKRILFLMTIIIVISIGVLFIFFAKERIYSDEQGFVDDANSVSLAILPMLKNTLITGDLATVQQTIDPIVKHHLVQKISILNPLNGASLLQSVNSENNVFYPLWFDGLVGSHNFEQKINIDIGGVSYGILKINVKDTSLKNELWELGKLFLEIGLVSMLLILWLLNVVLLKGLSPLTTLEEQANRLGNGDFSLITAVSVTSEISAVTNAFNSMIKNIQSKIQALEYANDEQKRLSFELHIELEKNFQKSLLLEQQSRLASMGEMIGNIAHQWRQPLSVITSYASSLALKHGLQILQDDDISDTVNHIMKKANYLSATIDDFRNFIQNDRKKEDFIVQKSMSNAMDIVDSTLKDNFIQMQIIGSEDNFIANGFKNELTQVFINIINNAKDILCEKGLNLKAIKIMFFRDDEHFFVTIQDNAGGIPDNIISKIFDPYFTTKHQSQGTGLGLYMSAKIIKDHFDGNLYVENDEIIVDDISYIGAKFVIKLPLV